MIFGNAAMALIGLFTRVRCRRCGDGDCPGCIDGPLFCFRPDPAVDMGAEEEPISWLRDPAPPPPPPPARGDQLVLFTRPEWP